MGPCFANVLKVWKEEEVHQGIMFFETIHYQQRIANNLKSVHSKGKRKSQENIDCTEFNLIIGGVLETGCKMNGPRRGEMDDTPSSTHPWPALGGTVNKGPWKGVIHDGHGDDMRRSMRSLHRESFKNTITATNIYLGWNEVSIM